jgi:hypothetical protein
LTINPLQIQQYDVEFGSLKAAACDKGWKMTCDTWNWYRNASVEDFVVDPVELMRDTAFGAKVKDQLDSWSGQAVGRCGSASCDFDGDSRWLPVSMTSRDGALAFRGMNVRVQSDVNVSM